MYLQISSKNVFLQSIWRDVLQISLRCIFAGNLHVNLTGFHPSDGARHKVMKMIQDFLDKNVSLID